MKKTHITEQKFADLDLLPQVIEGLEKKGFDYCTPIQALALPVLLTGQDIAGQAQTGTGKTLAFLTATFNHLLKTPEHEGRKPNQPRFRSTTMLTLWLKAQVSRQHLLTVAKATTSN